MTTLQRRNKSRMFRERKATGRWVHIFWLSNRRRWAILGIDPAKGESFTSLLEVARKKGQDMYDRFCGRGEP